MFRWWKQSKVEINLRLRLPEALPPLTVGPSYRRSSVHEPIFISYFLWLSR